MKRMIFLLSFGLSGALFAEEAQIPIIGIDAQGAPFEVTVSRSQYVNRLEKLITGTHDATLPALRKLSEDGEWIMHTVIVGIGLNFEIGIDKIAAIGITPRMRFAFTKQPDPIVP